MSCAGIPTNPHAPVVGARHRVPQLVPPWTLALMAVGLVSRESVIRQSIERQQELLNIIKVASEFKAVEELAKAA